MNVNLEIQRQQCRVCLEDVRFYKYFSEDIDLKNDSDENIDIFTAFAFCTHLEFTESEALEVKNQFICNSCVNSLKFAFEFVKKARESDTQLRLVEYLENEKEDEEDSNQFEVSNIQIEAAEDEVGNILIIDSTFQENQELISESIEETHLEIHPEEYILEDPEDEVQYGVPEEILSMEDDSCIENNEHPESEEEESVQKDCEMNLDESETVNEEITAAERSPMKTSKVSKHDCKICSKPFWYNFQLEHHMLTSHASKNTKNFACNQCDKKFFTKRHLVKHESTVHREGRDFKCNICGKEFQYKERLTRHLKTHLDRKYECSQCGKNYVQNADLQIHLRTHTNEKPYQCEQCPEAFHNQSRLTNHIKRVHMDIRYTCRYCNTYEVKSHSTLRRHEQEHLKFPYQCPKCDKEFSRRKYFKDHMDHVHDFAMPDADIDAMFIKNKNEIKRMEAELGNAKSSTTI